jgi:hypothetical protein
LVGVGVLVGVFVFVGVLVGVFVGVGVLVGVFVGVLVGVCVFVGVLEGVIGVGVIVGVSVFVGVAVLVGVFVGVGVAMATVMEPLVMLAGIVSPAVVSRDTFESVTGVVPLATFVNVIVASRPSPFGPLNDPVSLQAYSICAAPSTVMSQLIELPVLPRKPPSTTLCSETIAGFHATWNE